MQSLKIRSLLKAPTCQWPELLSTINLTQDEKDDLLKIELTLPESFGINRPPPYPLEWDRIGVLIEYGARISSKDVMIQNGYKHHLFYNLIYAPEEKVYYWLEKLQFKDRESALDIFRRLNGNTKKYPLPYPMIVRKLYDPSIKYLCCSTSRMNWLKLCSQEQQQVVVDTFVSHYLSQEPKDIESFERFLTLLFVNKNIFSLLPKLMEVYPDMLRLACEECDIDHNTVDCVEFLLPLYKTLQPLQYYFPNITETEDRYYVAPDHTWLCIISMLIDAGSEVSPEFISMIDGENMYHWFLLKLLWDKNKYRETISMWVERVPHLNKLLEKC